jgi:hypothetical protein
MESQGLLDQNKTPAAPLASSASMQKASAAILMMVLMNVPTKFAKKVSMTPYRGGHSTDCQIAWNTSTKAPKMACRLVSSSASTKLLKMVSKMAEVRLING